MKVADIVNKRKIVFYPVSPSKRRHWGQTPILLKTSVSTQRFWIHISSQIPQLMYPHHAPGYILQPKIHISCIHPTLLDTLLSPKSSTHVPTRRFWVHISAQNPQLMYPPHAPGYISPLKYNNSCIHSTLLGTYLSPKSSTHVSTPRFWVHISTQNPQLMYPPDASGYISPLKYNNSCIHPTLLGTYLSPKSSTHVSTSRFWIHISPQIQQLMYPPDASGYTSPPQNHNSCTHPTLLGTRLHHNLSTHVSTPRSWIHISTSKPQLMYPHQAPGYTSPPQTTTHVPTPCSWVHISPQI